MAEQHPVLVTKTGGESYTWSGFISSALTGAEWDELIIPNELKGKVRPEWVRVSVPLGYSVDQPVPPAAGLDGRALWEDDGSGAPQWRVADDLTEGVNAIRLAIFANNPGTEVFFVEYGGRHSVPR